jgi:hypothetical protein
MPLSPFHRDVLRLLARNRSPDSFVAGATVVNQAPGTPRFSDDIDLFHDTAESVAVCAEQDIRTLRANGYEVEWLLNQPTYSRAIVRQAAHTLKLEWAFDSAFRFFPVEADPDLGYRLNLYDAAINKVLALVGRVEARDFVDVLHLHRDCLSLGALCWAAAAKDPGLTPPFILAEARRTTHYSQAEIDRLELAAPLRMAELKQHWDAALQQATSLVQSLPSQELGVLYLNKQNCPVTPDPHASAFGTLHRHHGSIRGAWPKIRD